MIDDEIIKQKESASDSEFKARLKDVRSTVIFKDDNGKDIDLEHLFKKVYKSSEQLKQKINTVLDTTTGLITTPDDAAVLLPAVTNCFDAVIKSDKQLIEIGGLIQKFSLQKSTNSSQEHDSTVLSEEEKKMLKEKATEFIKENTKKSKTLIDSIPLPVN